jgi:uncharacterized membrane protein
MTHSTFADFSAAFESLARDIMRACRRAARELNTMPWPTMLGWCVVFALIISILPLAFCLFVLFLGAKVIAGAFIVERRTSLRKRDADEV